MGVDFGIVVEVHLAILLKLVGVGLEVGLQDIAIGLKPENKTVGESEHGTGILFDRIKLHIYPDLIEHGYKPILLEGVDGVLFNHFVSVLQLLANLKLSRRQDGVVSREHQLGLVLNVAGNQVVHVVEKLVFQLVLIPLEVRQKQFQIRHHLPFRNPFLPQHSPRRVLVIYANLQVIVQFVVFRYYVHVPSQGLNQSLNQQLLIQSLDVNPIPEIPRLLRLRIFHHLFKSNYRLSPFKLLNIRRNKRVHLALLTLPQRLALFRGFRHHVPVDSGELNKLQNLFFPLGDRVVVG